MVAVIGKICNCCCCFQVIHKKFSEFKLGVEAGTERYNQCEKLAHKLIDNKSPYSSEILQRQEHLG